MYDIVPLSVDIMKEEPMENYSYYSFHDVPCVLIEREDRITLIPCQKDDCKHLFNYIHNSDFEIDYSDDIYKCKHAFKRSRFE